jgi:tetratricopeptide (TPR) repeat protein
VRDGAAAVTNAQKACELTEWKQSSSIRTLAAAYAETGDFDQAILYEKRALRIGPPTDAERKDAEARIALYKNSQPLRTKP